MTTMTDEGTWAGRGPAEGGGDFPAVDGDSAAAGGELNGTFLGRYDGFEAPGGRTLQALMAEGPGPEGPELILDASRTLLPFHFLRTGDRLGRAVVKLLRGDGASGSGFLVAPGVLLTNHHVLPDQATAAASIVLANYEAAPPAAAPGRPASAPLDPESLFVTDAELDFTFCGVRGLDFLGSIGLDRNSRNIGPMETVNIIQHPRGRPKEVALRDNRVVKADAVVVHYACSTEPGSSGSPVFNNRWEAVALHHASVLAEGPGPVAAEGPPPRYLNEGIRVSAIAIWLEIERPIALEAHDQVERIRGIVGGIDPRVGFFGALGRKAHGKSAAAVVFESDRGDTDDLDLAFWDIRGLGLGSRDRIVDVGRVVAEMGMDLWCLSHADADDVAALREHLEAHHRLGFESFHEPAGARPALAVLYRRSKALAVERRAWGVGLPEGAELPPMVTVRAETRRSGTVAFQLVMAGRPEAAEAAPGPCAEAVRHAIRRGHGEPDWIVVGDDPAVFAPETLHVLADCERDLLAAAADRDGAAALLTGPRSKVARVFVSPNLRPALGVTERLSVARDREFPPTLRALGGRQPIAFRLTLDAEPHVPAAPKPPALPAAPPSPDDEFERRIRDVLAPIFAQFLGEVRSRPGAAG